VLCCREENGSWVEEQKLCVELLVLCCREENQKLCVELLVLCCAVERRMVAGSRSRSYVLSCWCCAVL